MNDELRDLYQEVIVEHGRHPRNFGRPDSYSHRIEGYNPLCGDQLILYMNIENDTIRDLKFDGRGCAISMASASLMTEALKGKPRDQALALFDDMHALLTTGASRQTADLGKLATLSGVSDFPSRIKCATLAWHAMKSALTGNQQLVTTETDAP